MISSLDLAALILSSMFFGYVVRGRVDELGAWLKAKRVLKALAIYEVEQAGKIDPHAHPMNQCGRPDLARLIPPSSPPAAVRAPTKIVQISVHRRPEPTTIPSGGRKRSQ